jgi:hypothetical protein
VNISREKFLRFATVCMMSAALSTALLFTVPRAQADDDHAKCQHRVEKAEARLDQAIRSHGERSAQAEARRRDLNTERERCWNSYKGWWSGTDKKWHTQRDWDHDDQGHDHDDHH